MTTDAAYQVQQEKSNYPIWLLLPRQETPGQRTDFVRLPSLFLRVASNSCRKYLVLAGMMKQV